MSKKCERFSKLKVKDLTVKNLCAENIKAKDTTLTNLNVTFINGRNVQCEPDIEIKEQGFDAMINGIPVRNAKINPIVFDALLANANAEYESLQERLILGREIIQQFERDRSCNTCGNTGSVPLTIYGYITKPLISEKTCGFTGGTGPNAFSSEVLAVQQMFYNLEVDYDVLVAQSTEPRVISVLCHLSYIDPVDNTPYVEEIIIGNRQFTPTVDPLYGEMFSGSIPINSDLVREAVAAMPSPNNSAAVQIVFYIEEGITIWTEKESLTDGRPSVNGPSYSAENPIPIPPTPPGCEMTVAFEAQVTGNVVEFFNISTPTEGVTFTWYFGDSDPPFVGLQPPAHTYPAPATYTVSLIAERPGCPSVMSVQQVEIF